MIDRGAIFGQFGSILGFNPLPSLPAPPWCRPLPPRKGSEAWAPVWQIPSLGTIASALESEAQDKGDSRNHGLWDPNECGFGSLGAIRVA